MTDWREMAKDQLRQYPRNQDAAARLGQQIVLLQERACDAPEEMELVSRLAELKLQRRQLQVWLEQMEKALGRLEREDVLLLRAMYMHARPNEAERQSIRTGQARATVYRRCNRALERFTLALYGAVQ